MALKFYNTLTRSKDEFKPLHEGEVRMYSCGPTVYDHPHVGNLRAFLFDDLLRRYLKYKGFKLKHAMNLTDVDDKTIHNSRKERMSLREFTDLYPPALKALIGMATHFGGERLPAIVWLNVARAWPYLGSSAKRAWRTYIWRTARNASFRPDLGKGKEIPMTDGMEDRGSIGPEHVEEVDRVDLLEKVTAACETHLNEEEQILLNAILDSSVRSVARDRNTGEANVRRAYHAILEKLQAALHRADDE